MCAVNNKIQANQCHDLENSLEALLAKLITLDHQSLYICSYYRPPDTAVDYLSSLRNQLEILFSRHHAKSPLIIMSGDFNISQINWVNNTAFTENGSSLLTIFDDFHLQQLVDDPTRYSHTSSNILDIVAISHPALISNLRRKRIL